MAIASLNKFTVPLASDASSPTQGMLMPKLKYRFRVTFDGFGAKGSTSTELTKQVNTVTRPNLQFAPQTIDIYNSKIMYAGKHTWQAMQLSLRDDASKNVQKLVGEQVQKQFDFLEQSSAAAAIDYKFTMKIEMLDGGNGQDAIKVLETWECYGCFITTVNWQNLSYAEATPATIELTIQPDNCIQTPADTGVGTIVARAAGVAATGSGS